VVRGDITTIENLVRETLHERSVKQPDSASITVLMLRNIRLRRLKSRVSYYLLPITCYLLLILPSAQKEFVGGVVGFFPVGITNRIEEGLPAI
jgi:hypothetical protein